MLATNHSFTFFSSLFTSEKRQCIFSWVFQKICIVCKHYWILMRLEAFLKSLIYKKDISGANTDPWGTPHSTNSKLVLVVESISIYYFLFERKLFIQLWLLSLIPYSSSFLSTILWSTVSKSFWKVDRHTHGIQVIFKTFKYLVDKLNNCMVS